MFNQSGNFVDPDLIIASSEAKWSGSSVFSKEINLGSAGQELSN